MARGNLIRIVDRYYLFAVALMMVLTCWLQDSQRLAYSSYFYNMREAILAGFDGTTFKDGSATSRVWGYAWVLICTESPFVQLLIQSVLALFSLFVFVRHLEKSKTLAVLQLVLIKLAFVVCIPWYAIHSQRDSASIAASLFLLAVVLFHDGIFSAQGRYWRVVLSGSLFGLMLNFRSDLVYLIPVFGLLAVLYSEVRIKAAGKSLLWISCILLVLLPWAVYTKINCGHYLITSTNSGHVFYVGLGNYPGNKWGITFSDGDESMHAFVSDYFERHPSEANPRSTSTMTYEADRVLNRRFRQLVFADPDEYMKKCVYTFCVAALRGPWEGTFIDRDTRRQILHSNPLRLLNHGVGGVIGIIALGQSVLLSLSCFAVFPIVAYRAARFRQTFLLLIVVTFAYQIAIITFASYMRNYLSFAVTLMIVIAVSGLAVMANYGSSRVHKVEKAAE